MRRACSVQIGVYTMLSGMMLSLMSMASLYGQHAHQGEREQIGEVLGQPVYRDAIRTGKDVQVRDELHRLFAAPIMQKYRQRHKAEIEPTEDEIVAVTAFFDKKHRERIKEKEPELREKLKVVEGKLGRSSLTKEQQRQLEIERRTLEAQLKPPGRFFAMFMLSNWKFQKHLYERYGGGRILWQQAGLEAFDAYRTWLEVHEKQGDFKIADRTLRSTFYEYWTTMNHGAHLTDDKKLIRSEFLEPEWMPKARAKD
jgi:Skp family chaperone for outer membrane proteins